MSLRGGHQSWRYGHEWRTLWVAVADEAPTAWTGYRHRNVWRSCDLAACLLTAPRDFVFQFRSSLAGLRLVADVAELNRMFCIRNYDFVFEIDRHSLLVGALVIWKLWKQLNDSR